MKNVLITGGTRGIGKALAVKFAKSGYNVAVTYVNSENSAKQLNSNYGIKTFKVDVKNYQLAKETVDKVVDLFGGIDVLINNAGIAPKQKLLLDVTESEFDNVISVNLKGAFNYSKAVINYMLNSGGVICNVSSVQGLRGGSCEVVYSASKSAINGFTRALQDELSFSNISVFAVAPTITETDMNGHLTSEDKLEFLQGSNLSSVPTAEEVAEKTYNLIQNANNLRVETVELYPF